MFDLEQSIAEWRKQMLAAGIKTPVPLEELEIHLREEIERQIKSGTNPQPAFENSVRQMGQADELKGEFKKICATHRLYMYGKRQFYSQRTLPRWSSFWWGVNGLIVTWISSWADPLVLHLSASWNYWLPTYVAFTTFAISGLVIGFARWQTKWTFLWVSSLGLIGTMMVNSACRFVFHRSDLVSIFLQRGHIPWVAFYMIWALLITTGLFMGLFNWNWKWWFNKWIFQRKTARD